MNSLVLQRFARTSLVGIEVEARTDLADEPVFEAEALGVLLEYKEVRMCRRLARRLMDDGRLSWRSCHGGTTENAADNYGLTVKHTTTTSKQQRPVDVFVVVEHERVGTVVRDVEKLWLTERACLLVATASETERAWQVRTALVDFFLAYRRERTNASSLPSTVVHEVLAARAETRAMLDEVRAIRSEVVQAIAIDARIRALEAQPKRKPNVASRTTPLEALAAAVLPVLAEHPEGLTTSELLDIARPAIDAARGRYTHKIPLGKELTALMTAGHPIEQSWHHNHSVKWRRKRDG